jgi:tRNA pseudouridine38-40 synthase
VTQRYRLLVEYDGRPFCGWQRQAEDVTVQGAIEAAFFKFCGERVICQGAGRTDAGVHARGQVAHVDLEKAWSVDKVQGAVNQHLLPLPASILKVEKSGPHFHARFSALSRHYVYRIINRRAPLTIDNGFAWHIKRKVNAVAMAEAAKFFVGEHDFSTFRDAECQAESPVRTIDRFDVVQMGEAIECRVSAQSFLHRQVRSMVGSLENVGSGKWTPQNLKQALDARDRKACGPVAPPDGLCLERVDYPDALVANQSSMNRS